METILYLDCHGFKPLPSGDSLRLIGRNYHVESVTDIGSARQILDNSSQVTLLVTNNPNYELLKQFRSKHSRGSTILVTAMPMSEYSKALQNMEEDLVDHVVSNRNKDSWTTHDLRVTVAKIASKDIFGIEKYLSSNTPIHREPIRSSLEREELNNKVMEFSQACHLGQHTSRMAFGITEELLMNSIYDAPAAAGIMRFKNIEQTTGIQLLPEEQGELTFACDGRILAIATSDPFGALKKKKLFQYLKKVLKRSSTEGLIDTKKGGAGLGLFKILYSSHAVVCNVEVGRKTEIMALIDVNEQLRDFSVLPRSIHYFSIP